MTMHLFNDIQSPVLLYLKGGLFGLLAVMAGALAVFADNLWHEVAFLVGCVWSSCRFYYFLFYVLDHYVGGGKNAGIFAMVLKLCGKQQSVLTPDASTVTGGNLFAELPQSLPEELIENLAASKNVRIERIVSTGHASPPGFFYDQYDQAEHEWVVVLQGEAILEIEGENESKRLLPGDYILIPPHRKHRVAWTSPNEPTVWLAVFFD